MEREIQAKSEEWTTQTAIYCDTFWLQSIGTTSSLANKKFMCYCTVFALFYFLFEGKFQVQAPGDLNRPLPSSTTPSLSKRGQVLNLSCENEFYLQENQKLFPYQRLST